MQLFNALVLSSHKSIKNIIIATAAVTGDSCSAHSVLHLEEVYALLHPRRLELDFSYFIFL